MRRFLGGVFVGILLCVVMAFGGVLLVGSWLAVEDPLEKADAIVAISGDTGARADAAVALWKAGWAPVIVFAGAAIDPESVSSAEIMRREALRQGVPEGAMLVEPASTTTEENAAFVARLMVERKLRSAILVTSPFHQRRASMEFDRAFAPSGLVFRNHPASDPEWNAFLWWRQEPTRSRTLLELVKLGAVFLQSR
ncbi:MAG TPA: YdcF family protein [Candidatus Limnocylindria bacterium]|nr:YdcF family protein [Candidatus Limnocylindria bacterium]